MPTPPAHNEAADTRQQPVSSAFVTLADTLATEFDIADSLDLLAERCLELLDVSAAGVTLIGPTVSRMSWLPHRTRRKCWN